jgi:uncharacterized membrane protein
MLSFHIKEKLHLPINFVVCHRLPDRSFFFRGKQFPLCSRCTGLALGYLFYPFFLSGLFNFHFLLLIFLHLPMIIDGLTQLYFERESTNGLRFFTGLLAGISQIGILDFFALHSAKFILKYII